MIDLLKQYADSGILLPEYQLKKLPRNLLITYFRRRDFIRNPIFIVGEKEVIIDGIKKNFFNETLLLKFLKTDLSHYFFKEIEEPSDKLMIAAVLTNPKNLKLIENPPLRVMELTIMKNRHAIQYIENPSEDLQLLAIDGKHKGVNIKFIDDPTEKVQLAAIEDDFFNLEHIKNPTKKVILTAISRDYQLMRFVENPSEDLQLAAIEINPRVIGFINNPSYNALKSAIDKDSKAFYTLDKPTQERIRYYFMWGDKKND
jgi:hypothetical protein